MSLKARAASYTDVDHVLDRLSTISADEMRTISRTRWHALANAKACKHGGGLDCLFFDHDNPLAIFGTVPLTDTPYIHRTFFIASQEYFDAGPKAVFGSMRFMKGVSMAKPRITFEAMTASTHPDLNRWFAHMGFEKQEECEGITLFRRFPRSVDEPGNVDAA